MERLRFKFPDGLSGGLLTCISCISLLCILLVCRCSGLSAPGYEGMYVSSAESEFSIAHDTLHVKRDAGNDLVFLLHRRTGFQLLDAQGRAGDLQLERESWTAVLDPQTGMLTEQRYGKRISFDEQRTVLRVGKREYRRIK